jgi:hypothetical protein
MNAFLLVRMVLAHFIADFWLQGSRGISQRREKKWKCSWLYIHGVIAAVLVYLFSFQWNNWWLPLVVLTTHVMIDGLKARRPDTPNLFVLDQLAHIGVIIACWSYIIYPCPTWSGLRAYVDRLDLWLVVLCYIVVIWPVGSLIGRITKRWRKPAGNHSGQASVEDSDEGGLYIGRLERFLILTLILMNRFEAIAFLIAAKSVFRFSELHARAEYVIIGSLFSFAAALLAGIGLRYLLSM